MRQTFPTPDRQHACMCHDMLHLTGWDRDFRGFVWTPHICWHIFREMGLEDRTLLGMVWLVAALPAFA